jgi:rubrerythrin
MRYSDKSEEEKCRTILFEIVEEEKSHLASLGRLIEKEYQRT